MFKNIAKLIFAAVVVVMAVSLAVSGAEKLPFDDVKETKWYYDAVAEAYETGLMKGQSETKFAPNKTISRAEFVTLLYRLAGVNEDGFAENLASFADGKTDKWYSEAMGWGVKRGLIKGNPDNTVKPGASVTRAELAVMIVRYLDYMGYRLPEVGVDENFTDHGKIAKWCRTEVYTCKKWGIFEGDAQGNFNPSKGTTRAEGATIALRLVKSVDSLLEEQGIVIARSGESSDVAVLYKMLGGSEEQDARFVINRIDTELDVDFIYKAYVGGSAKLFNRQIILNVPQDADIAEMSEPMVEGDYAIKLKRDGEYTKLLLAYTTRFSRAYALEFLLTKYVKDGVLAVPADLDISGNVTERDFLTVTDSINKNTRDPFIFYEDGVYYMYCTGWRVYKNTSGSINGEWVQIENAVVKPADYKKCNWAPEMFKYNGSYYLFTTYSPNYTRNEFENHGCIIMKADSPEGPFKMITDGWITPPEWDCIDGTLYVDPDGTPWMIFSHEHTSLDGNGAFAAAQLSEDLTHFVSEPIELFRAKEPTWAEYGITDGCFMYTTEDGELLMLWSNNDEKGYCVGVARSSNGRLDGEWTHDEPRLFSGWMTGSGETNKIDGGHGMIFTDTDGQMYLVIHAPNDWGGDSSRMTLVPIIERNGTLVWDLNLE